MHRCRAHFLASEKACVCVGFYSNVHLVALKFFRLFRDGIPVLWQMAVDSSAKVNHRLKEASTNSATRQLRPRLARKTFC